MCHMRREEPWGVSLHAVRDQGHVETSSRLPIGADSGHPRKCSHTHAEKLKGCRGG